MKKIYFLFVLTFFVNVVFAQFGTFKTKESLDAFKDTKLVVVLFQDSAYSASIETAMNKYWSYTAVEYAFDIDIQKDIQKYRKGNYAFLIFSKAKGSKNKAKLGSSEEDFNGLAIINKFSKRVTKDNLLAYAFCNNKIDTNDWETETIRGVQLLNNYFNSAVQVGKNSGLSESAMMSDYPSDKSLMLDLKLLIENNNYVLKGKDDPATLFNGDIDIEADAETIQQAIKNQDKDLMYFFYAKDEKTCNRLFVTAANSELMYFYSTSPEKCKCEAKDLKELKEIKDQVSKSQK
jgi:hypothetical protein